MSAAEKSEDGSLKLILRFVASPAVMLLSPPIWRLMLGDTVSMFGSGTASIFGIFPGFGVYTKALLELLLLMLDSSAAFSATSSILA